MWRAGWCSAARLTEVAESGGRAEQGEPWAGPEQRGRKRPGKAHDGNRPIEDVLESDTDGEFKTTMGSSKTLKSQVRVEWQGPERREG